MSTSKFLVLPKPQPLPAPKLKLNAKQKQGTLKALAAIRALFGPKGQYWTTGTEHDVEEVETPRGLQEIHKFCLIGAVHEANGKYEDAAHAAIALAILEFEGRLEDVKGRDELEEVTDAVDDEETVTTYNDNNTWPLVKKVLTRAKQLVKAA